MPADSVVQQLAVADMSYEKIGDNLYENDVDAQVAAAESLVAERWRAYLFAKIDAAVSENALISAEAAEWYRGVDACTQVEYLVELDSFFAEYRSSGLAALGEVKAVVVQEPLLTDDEKKETLEQVRGAEYQERLAITAREIYRVVLLRAEQKKLEGVVARLDLASQKIFTKNFYETVSDEKSNVIQSAEVAVRQAQARQETERVQEFETDLIQQIQREIDLGDLVRATQLVDNLGSLTRYGKSYGEWSKRINSLRIAQLKEELLLERAA
jgi:hypothetical protein